VKHGNAGTWFVLAPVGDCQCTHVFFFMLAKRASSVDVMCAW
jgi:hypothetical protein